MSECTCCGRALTTDAAVCADCEAEVEQLAKLANTAHALAARLDVAGEHGASDVAWDIKTALEQIVARRRRGEADR